MDETETASLETTQQEVKSKLDSRMADRVDLLPIMEAIENGSFESPVPDELFTADIGTETAKQTWDQLKTEKNALVALFIQEIWNEFKQVRINILNGDRIDKGIEKELTDKTGKLEKWKNKVIGYFNFIIRNNLRGNFQDDDQFIQQQRILRYTSLISQETFNAAIKKWQIKHREKLAGDPANLNNLDQAYQRYCQIIQFGHQQNLTLSGDEKYDIEQGIVTARETIYGLFELVPKVLKLKGIPLTADNVRAVILNSYGPFVQRFASLHNYIAIPLLKALRVGSHGNGFNPQFFDITSQNDSFKLTIDHSILMNAKDKSGHPILEKQLTSDTTWCPARYADGETKDVIREYFEWCFQLADKHYFQNL